MSDDIDIVQLADTLARIDWTQHLWLARRVHGDILKAFIRVKPRKSLVRQGRPPTLNPTAKQAIRERHANGESVSYLARYYCVARSTIYRTLNK